MPELESALRSLEGRGAKARRVSARRRRRAKPVGRATRVPRQLQMAYAQALQALIEEARKVAERVILPDLPRLERRVVSDSKLRLDGTAEEIALLIERLVSELDPVFSDVLIERIVNAAAMRANTASLRDVTEQLEAMGAAGVALSSLSTSEQIELFVRTNTKLIRTVQSDMIGMIEGTITRGARQGLRHEEIARNLFAKATKKNPGGDLAKTQKRMRLIARDQISKLNGELARVRHTEAGIVHYRWITARDGRERDTHAANDGKIFRYDDPPATGHPGEEINCRCSAAPILPAISEDREALHSLEKQRL